MPCSLVGIYLLFGVTHHLHFQGPRICQDDNQQDASNLVHTILLIYDMFTPKYGYCSQVIYLFKCANEVKSTNYLYEFLHLLFLLCELC
jgi:hypothetical protein